MKSLQLWYKHLKRYVIKKELKLTLIVRDKPMLIIYLIFLKPIFKDPFSQKPKLSFLY